MIVRRSMFAPFSRASALASTPARALLPLSQTRGAASKKPGRVNASVQQRDLAARQNDKEARLRDQKRRLEKLRLKAQNTEITPVTVDVPTAARYFLAAEVGQKESAGTVSIMVRLALPMHFQSVRGSVRLPRPPKRERIAVFTEDEEIAKLALANGATYAGGEDLIARVRKEDIAFEKAFATPGILTSMRSIMRILGPKGLMPNERRGTVSQDVVKLISESTGQLDFRTRSDTVSAVVARATMSATDMENNVRAFMAAFRLAIATSNSKQKPLISEVMLMSTHGPSVNILA
ncbi:mitochondrial 54S ribosomal protein uL1m [Limtongia smithiae]|uniref:mitochondrial 54S ribosomal protein uL1m n=1 Tax=Limtongia smithiae TaxID=1125753 RepID=UPI0034CF927D